MGAQPRAQLDVLPSCGRRSGKRAGVEGGPKLRGHVRREMRWIRHQRIAERMARGGRTAASTQTRGGVAGATSHLERALRRSQACPLLSISAEGVGEDIDEPVQAVVVRRAFVAIVEDAGARTDLKHLRASSRGHAVGPTSAGGENPAEGLKVRFGNPC